MRVSTEVAPAKERFDFWHALFPGSEMRHTVREHGYGAAALSCAGDDGIAFTDLACAPTASRFIDGRLDRSEEHTSELQSLMRNSYAVFCLKTKKQPIWLLSRTHAAGTTSTNPRNYSRQCVSY